MQLMDHFYINKVQRNRRFFLIITVLTTKYTLLKFKNEAVCLPGMSQWHDMAARNGRPSHIFTFLGHRIHNAQKTETCMSR
jgi:hypothetical protein